MPGLDGLALQHRLRETGPTLPIVFITGHGDIPMSVRAIKAGAVELPDQAGGIALALVTAVRAAHRTTGRGTAQPHADVEAMPRPGSASLTPREREVLAARGARQAQQADCGRPGHRLPTVKFHRARLMERMQARTLAELMHIAATIGIR